MARITSCVVAAALLCAADLSAQSPASAPDIPLDYERFTLDNGLTVIVHEDRKAPIVGISVWYDVGSKDEPPGRTGFAHLFEHLMFTGSEHQPDWFAPLEEAGATTVNGTTSRDRTNYLETVPTPALDLALWMESDRMGHLLGAITQEKLDNQRGVVQNEKRQGDNTPYGRVNYNLYAGLFPPGHPYRHDPIGSMEDLDAASLEDVQEWFRAYYGPNNAVLALAGDIDVETAREKVTRYFGDIPAGPEVDGVDAWIPTRTHNTTEVQHDEVPAVLANRAWVIPGRTTREFALLDIAADVLGRGRNARLYRDLVYDRQLASSVNVSAVPYLLAGVFDLSVTLTPGQTAAVASEAIDRIMDEFLANGPTADEIARVATNINASMIRGLERVGGFSGKATILAEGELYAGDPLFITRYLTWINEATPEEVRDVARRYLGDGWHQIDVVPVGDYQAAGTGVDRTAGPPPIPTEVPDLAFPDIAEGRLSNGLRVIVAERPAVPVVRLSMQFDAGYAADAGGTLGLASFTASMLDRGTTTRDTLEIAAEAEGLGAQISAQASLDATSVTLSALTAELTPSVALWADVIRHPAFAPDEIDRLRSQWIAGIAQEKATPVNLALRLLPPAIYGAGHAYSVPYTGSGTVASIESITRDDLVAFHRAWLRPDNATVFVVGDTTLAEITPVLEAAFAGWAAPATPRPEKNVSPVERPSSPRIALIDRPGSPQSLILAGHVAPGLGTDRDLSIATMNDVLGGGFSGRVNMNLREDKGWAYGASTILFEALGPRPFIVYAPVQADRTGDSLAELVRELEAIRTSRPVTADEMNRVIAGATRGLPGQFETAAAVLGSLVDSVRYGRPLDYAASLPSRYDVLALEQVQAEATEIVHPESLVWVVVGDLSQIREQVEAVGIAPVEIWNDDGERIE